MRRVEPGGEGRSAVVHTRLGGLEADLVVELAEPLPAMRLDRVAVAGDAAHAMTPDLGQGGCMALEDGAVLGVLARGRTASDVQRLLAAYDAERRPRTTAVARRSRRAGRLYLAPVAVQQLAARAMGKLPDAAVAKGLAAVVDRRPPAADGPSAGSPRRAGADGQ